MTPEPRRDPNPIRFQAASLLVLPTRRNHGPYKQAADFVHYQIKNPKEPSILHTLTRLTERGGPVLDLVAGADLAIPVPSSQRLVESAESSQWPSLVIAEQLKVAGMTSRVEPYLQRTRTVRRSRSLRTEDRVTVAEHFDSLSFTGHPSLMDAAVQKILLVDDVLTKGTTLAACYRRVREGFPDAEVIGFAIARTDNDTELAESADMFAPELDAIVHWRGDSAARRQSSR